MTTTPSADPAHPAPSGSSRGPYAKGVQRRREILDRALEVFAEKGSESTSLRAIGEAIGVSHAALTHYFESREALLVEVLRERDAQTRSAARAEATSSSPGHPLAELTAAADHNVQVPGLVALHTVMMAAAVEPGHEVAREFFEKRFAEGRESVAEGVRDALGQRTDVSATDLDDFAALVLAASDGLQIQWLLDPTVDIAASLRLLERVFAR